MRRWILLLGFLALPAWGGEGITLVGPDGNEAVLRPAEGEVLILHFWATWCPSCAEDLDNLQRAVAACSKILPRAIAVNVGEDERAVADFVEKHSVRLPIFRDPKGRVWRKVDGRGLPMNLYWTQEHRRTDVGPKTVDGWRRQLASLGCEDRAHPNQRSSLRREPSPARQRSIRVSSNPRALGS